MLGGRISNHDEDEVEDELDALEAEVTGIPLPSVPTAELPFKEGETLPDVPIAELAKEKAKERAKARQSEREERGKGRVAILA